jgi:16S rRNA (guanine966-N2)-methyltransferase
MDRIKESIFNILGDVQNISFLDLFAGTGSMGIEAISRGAREAIFIENNPNAVKVIKENLQNTGFAEFAEVICRPVDKAVEMLEKQEKNFDIIFMDPPYGRDLAKTSLYQLDSTGLVAAKGIVITETGKNDVLPDKIGRLYMVRHQKYGDTVITFFREA